jgi:hypothetical protein
MPSLAPEAALEGTAQVRIWFSRPRLFNGLVRPWISFALCELSKNPSRAKRGRRDEGAPAGMGVYLRHDDNDSSRLARRDER